jgi:LuxR family maltose regulon positive regulatory protein
LLSRLTDFSPWYQTETRIVIARALVRLDDVPAARAQMADAGRELRLTPDAPLLAQWLAQAEIEADAAAMSGRWPLTKTELRVLQYLPGHLSFPKIAEELFLSLNTVKTHVRSIYLKLDVSSRAEAVACAREAGLLGEGGDPSPPSQEL